MTVTVPGSNTEERLNNAISLLALHAHRARDSKQVSAGTVAAIDALADHWQHFWRGTERSVVPALALRGKLSRYAEWYTRGWALMPLSYRAMLPQPDQIDPTLAGVARDTLRGYLTGVESVGNEAAKLRTAIESSVSTGLLGIALGALAAWYILKAVK